MKDFTEVLHEVGQRATPTRLAVLSVLEKEKRPLSVEKIISIIGEDDIDYVTAYRTITMLKKAGLVRQIDFQHNHAHYELTSLGDHHHVVCTRCNKVADVLDCNVQTMIQNALRASKFAEINQHSLEFFGLCKQCAL
jgi:Fur family transcriptional regulator, ferric uptake regulator